MARFEGTIQEFHHYIGPRIRNKVNNLTATARKKRNGICEHCGQEKELQSAHVHGNERRMIIENVLSGYQQEGFISCDLAVVEREILEAHQPIDEKFLFLCQECHKKYDSKEKIFSEKRSFNVSVENTQEKNETGRQFQTNKKQKIGEYVKSQFYVLVNKGYISGVEIKNLLDVEYSKRVFDLNFPFLRRRAEGRLDHNGYSRYYAEIHKINEQEYYLCSQWYDRQQTKVADWIMKIKSQK